MKNLFILLLALGFLMVGQVEAQSTEPDLKAINQDRISMNSSGMLVLGGWAVSNIVSGTIGMTQTGGQAKYFHEMNTAWNTVNLAIAGFGYYGLRNQSADIGLSETIKEFHSFEKALLFNAGLDIGYMAAGAYLWERGIRTDSDRLIGYGKSMILQGGFLFTFDLVLYAMSRSKSSDLIDTLQHVQFNGTSVSVSIPF